MDPGALLDAAEARLRWPRLVPADERWMAPTDDLLERVRAAERPLVLAGPGVVADGAIAGLQALATAADLGVVNTWGAKGVFDWRSRHHLATVGLQARDAELAGAHDCDLLICTGIDAGEADPALWRRAPAIDVPTGMLAPLAEAWWRPRAEITMPQLRDRLASVTQEGWAATGTPITPSQVTRTYGEIVAAGGTVAADPGVSGYWVARTLGTTRPGAVHVPADAGAAGFAVACAIVARRLRPDAPALAVVDQMTTESQALLDLGEPVAVEVWDDDGDALDVDAHRARVLSLARQGGVARLATRGGQFEAMVAAAGPVSAWGGVAPSSLA
jgi:thiamine pyrophosphate-dependent acetolactate synthase large subunit-like protein